MIRLFRVTLGLVLINATLGLIAVQASPTSTQNVNTMLKQVIPNNPELRKSNIEPAALVNWVRDAAVMSFYYNYNNMDSWLGEYSTYFTPLGWVHYYNALKNSGNIERVRNEKITVTATPIEPPKVLWEGVDMNVYKWQVQVALLVHYQQQTGKTVEQKLMITMMLRRTDATNSKNGIAIDQFIAKPL